LANPREPLFFLVQHLSRTLFQHRQCAENSVALAAQRVKIGLVTLVDLERVEVFVMQLACIDDLGE
jgi:hypothetical protein